MTQTMAIPIQECLGWFRATTFTREQPAGAFLARLHVMALASSGELRQWSLARLSSCWGWGETSKSRARRVVRHVMSEWRLTDRAFVVEDERNGQENGSGTAGERQENDRSSDSKGSWVDRRTVGERQENSSDTQENGDSESTIVMRLLESSNQLNYQSFSFISMDFGSARCLHGEGLKNSVDGAGSDLYRVRAEIDLLHAREERSSLIPTSSEEKKEQQQQVFTSEGVNTTAEDARMRGCARSPQDSLPTVVEKKSEAPGQLSLMPGQEPEPPEKTPRAFPPSLMGAGDSAMLVKLWEALKPPKRKRFEQVIQVWRAYKAEFPRVRLFTVPEYLKIHDRVEDGSVATPPMTVAELCLVPKGVKLSSWHMGDNPSGKTYTGIETIFRDFVAVQKHVELYNGSQDISPPSQESSSTVQEAVKTPLESTNGGAMLPSPRESPSRRFLGSWGREIYQGGGYEEDQIQDHLKKLLKTYPYRVFEFAIESYRREPQAEDDDKSDAIAWVEARCAAIMRNNTGG